MRCYDSNQHSIINHNCTGSDGNAYTSVQEAINAMNGGDDIYLREGRYEEGHINIPPSKNGTSSKWSTLQSYPGEWAILDGQRNCPNETPSIGSVLGYAVSGYEEGSQIKYWRFERLEITGGGSPDGKFGSGFFGNGGPFYFRYCYIHDNLATEYDNNPGGVTGHAWHDSIIEYCYFYNNGSDGAQSNNCANINIYSDYQPNYIAQYGYPSSIPISNARNEYRYNLIVGSQVGIKYKQDQFFTGRNPEGGHPYSDTYKTYGDKVHHNIIQNTGMMAIDARQDFIQIYNNIIDGCKHGIKIGEDDTRTIYKPVVYNNTIISPTNQGISRSFNKGYSFEPAIYYGYEYNNILDNVKDGWNWSDSATLIAAPYQWTPLTPDFSNIKINKNYYYRPGSSSDDPDGIRVISEDPNHGGTRQTIEQYETAHPNTNLYRNVYNTNNPLYVGTLSADKYITRGDHVLEGSTTIASGGIGGNHPYLTGVILPSYVGATNPDDPKNNAWVDGVFSLSNIEVLKEGSKGSPWWSPSVPSWK